MKKLVMICLVMFVFVSLVFAEVTQEAERFTVVYTVKYNSLTLKEAYNKEMEIKREFKDACNVDTEVKEGFDDSGLIIWTAD